MAHNSLRGNESWISVDVLPIHNNILSLVVPPSAPIAGEDTTIPDPRTGVIGDGDPVDFVDVGPLLVARAAVEEGTDNDSNKKKNMIPRRIDNVDNECAGGAIGTNTRVQTGDIRAAVVLGALALVDGNETDWKIIVAGVDDLERLADVAANLECGRRSSSSFLASGLGVTVRVPNDLRDVPVDVLNRVHTFFRDYKTADGRPQLEFGIGPPGGEDDWGPAATAAADDGGGASGVNQNSSNVSSAAAAGTVDEEVVKLRDTMDPHEVGRCRLSSIDPWIERYLVSNS